MKEEYYQIYKKSRKRFCIRCNLKFNAWLKKQKICPKCVEKRRKETMDSRRFGNYTKPLSEENKEKLRKIIKKLPDY